MDICKKYIVNLKILIFHVCFLNMDISLTIALIIICLKMCRCIAEICIKGTVFQNLDLGFSFCICYVEVGILKDNYKNSQKLPVFYHKI